MIQSIRTLLLNSKQVQTSPKYSKLVNYMMDMVQKNANRIIFRGTSQNGAVQIKVNSMMQVIEIKINPEAIVNNNSEENARYLRAFADVIEAETLSAYQDAKGKIDRTINKASQEMIQEQQEEDGQY